MIKGEKMINYGEYNTGFKTSGTVGLWLNDGDLFRDDKKNESITYVRRMLLNYSLTQYFSSSVMPILDTTNKGFLYMRFEI